MDAMDKMWLSFAAMGLMVLASLTITFARIKTKGIVRALLSAAAFTMLIVAAVSGLISIA